MRCWRRSSRRCSSRRACARCAASINYDGQSRLPGVHINYYLKSAANGVTVRIYDGARMIAETTNAPGNAGLNTVRWTMQSSRPMTEAEQGAWPWRPRRGGGGSAADGAAAGAAAHAAVPTCRPANMVTATVPPG